MSILNSTALLKFADASIGSWLCRILGTVNFIANGDSPTAPINSDQIRRVLIIRPGGMGDMVVLLPVINILKEIFPQVAVDIVCEKRNVAVLELAGLRENALVYDSNPLRFLWWIRRRKYDIAVDTEQFHHFSAVFAWLSGAPVRIGFKINPRRNPLYTHLVNYAPDGHEGDQFMRLVEPLGIANTCYDLIDTLSAMKLEIPAVANEEIKRMSGSEGFAAIHAGASSRHKLWHSENYVGLAKLMHQKHGLGIVLVGSDNDKGVSAAILKGAEASGCKAVSFAGKFDLATTAGVIKRAGVFIGSDSGLAHLAVALGVPTVVLFGPSDHLKWGIADHHHTVVRGNLPCSPCFIFGYNKPCRNTACMKQISAEEVLEAVRKVM